MFIEIAETIKQQKLGIRRIPGTKIATTHGEVIYTPPEGESVIRDKLANLEKFIHENDAWDPLIKMAIMHYQFEAIHPFIDGNGRTGRIINILFLVENNLLDSPILFLSHYILKNKQAYYEGLKRVTEAGAWENWIFYMLDAIEITAIETLDSITKIRASIEHTQKLVQEKAPKIYSKDLVEIIFQHPYCKIQFLEQAGIAKRQTASHYLNTLETLGILHSVKSGVERYFINQSLIQILST